MATAVDTMLPGPGTSAAVVYVHARGRIEGLPLEDVTRNELRNAVGRSFGMRASTFEMLDQDGQVLTEDTLLATVQSGKTVVIQEDEPTFNGKEDSRSDMGPVGAQLDALRDDNDSLRAELRDLRQAISAERSAREQASAGTMASVESRWDDLVREKAAMRNDYKGIVQEVQSMRAVLTQDKHERDTLAADLRRQVGEATRAVTGERRLRETKDGETRQQIDDVVQRMNASTRIREDSERRLDDQITRLQEALMSDQVSRAETISQVRAMGSDLSLKTERALAECNQATIETKATFAEMRSWMVQQQRDSAATQDNVASRCEQIRVGLEEESRARILAAERVAQQLTVLVESVQEEQQLRTDADADLTASVEIMQRKVDDQARYRDQVMQSMAKVEQHVQRKLDDLVKSQELELVKLQRLVVEEAEARDTGDSRLQALANRIEEAGTDRNQARMRQEKDIFAAVDSLKASVAAERRAREQFEDMVEDRVGGVQGSEGQRLAMREMAEELRGTQLEIRADVETLKSNRASDMLSLMSTQEATQRNIDAVQRTMDMLAAQLERVPAESMDFTRDLISKEVQERVEAMEDLRAVIQDCQTAVDKEATIRDTADIAVARVVSELRESLDQFDSKMSASLSALQQWLQQEATRREEALKLEGSMRDEALRLERSLREESLGQLSADFGKLQEDLQPVLDGGGGAGREELEALQDAINDERRARADADQRLRLDTKEAVEKEVTARMQGVGRVREEVLRETRERQDAVTQLGEVIAELRNSLETHTHELLPNGSDVQVTDVGSVVDDDDQYQEYASSADYEGSYR